MSNQMMKFYTSNLQTKVSEKDRTVEFVASKEQIDRDGEILKIKGLDLRQYKKNAVILLNHDRHSLPIGKATKIWKSGDELKVKIKFTEPEEYSVGDTVYRLVKGGYLNALSIGFIPDFDTPGAVEYPQKKQGKKQVYRIFHKAELLEISVVNCPANPAALITGKSLQDAYDKEVIDELEYKELERELLKYVQKEEKTTDDEQLVEEKTKRAIEEDYGQTEFYTELKSYFDELYQEFEANYSATKSEQKGNPAKEKLPYDEVESLIDYLNN